MSSFDVELRALVNNWHERGCDIESMIVTMRDEIESLQDIHTDEDNMKSR